MSSVSVPIAASFAEPRPREATDTGDGARIREIVEREHDFVWRSIRRLGVSMSDVDDAVQKVFLVTARRLSDVPVGRERSFLFAIAMRVASNERRAERRKLSAGPEPLDGLVSRDRSPEQVVSDRAVLDAVLEPLPLELRSIVVLFELEQLTTQEIGELLELPTGTVASRLRRARELIDSSMKRMRAQEGATS